MTAYGDNWIIMNAKKKILHEKYVKFLKEEKDRYDWVIKLGQNYMKSLQNAATKSPEALDGNGEYDPNKTKTFFDSFHHSSLPPGERVYGKPLEPMSEKYAETYAPNWAKYSGSLDHILADYPPQHHEKIKELASQFFANNQHSHMVIDPEYHPHGPLLSPNMAGEPFLRSPMEARHHPQSVDSRLLQIANHFASTLTVGPDGQPISS